MAQHTVPPPPMSPAPSPETSPAAAPPAPIRVPAVLITNISPETEERQLRQWISFCGDITTMEFGPDGSSPGKRALIHFADPQSAQDAQKLDNAVGPGGWNVKIELLDETEGSTEKDSSLKKPIVGGIAAVVAGITLSGQALGDASRKFDEQHNISLNLQVAAGHVKVAAEKTGEGLRKVDEKIRLTETLDKVNKSTKEALKGVDNTLHITETSKEITASASVALATASNATAQGLQTVSEKVMSVPPIQKGWGLVRQQLSNLAKATSAVGKDISSTFGEVDAEAKRIVSEKRKADPSAQADADTASETQPLAK